MSSIRMRPILRASSTVRPPHPVLLRSSIPRLHQRTNSSLPPPSHFSPRLSRFRRYEDYTSPDSISSKPRNPLNYVDNEKSRLARNAVYRRRMWLCAAGIMFCVSLQLYLVFTFKDITAEDGKTSGSGSPGTSNTSSTGSSTTAQLRQAASNFASSTNTQSRLDAPPSGPFSPSSDTPVRIVSKPGEPSIKLDQFGTELIETGTSTIPHFPRHIHIPAPAGESTSPAATSAATTGAQAGTEEYTLLGLGIRTVSFLSIQVYVLGLYVRTSDLDTLQAAFVRHINPLGSSLIPSEKESLRSELLSADQSAELWDKVLKETRVRSAVRIVPTRGTDFAHLRDGWVRGITARTQEAAKRIQEAQRSQETKQSTFSSNAISEFDDPSFGESVGAFKNLMAGKGKAPKGSVVILTRDERGVMELRFAKERAATDDNKLTLVKTTTTDDDVLGRLDDERISRLVWLGYLGGKNVSSPGARESIVKGVMELVERPVGTVGSQVS